MLRWIFLRKVDFTLTAELGRPQAHATLQGAQHAAIPLGGVVASQFFEQGDGVESGIRLQQRDDLAIPHRTQGDFPGAPVSHRAL